MRMRKIKNSKKILIQNYSNINNLHYIQKINVFYWKWYLNYFKLNSYLINNFNITLIKSNKIVVNYITYLLFKNIYTIMYFSLLKQFYFMIQLFIFSLGKN